MILINKKGKRKGFERWTRSHPPAVGCHYFLWYHRLFCLK